MVSDPTVEIEVQLNFGDIYRSLVRSNLRHYKKLLWIWGVAAAILGLLLLLALAKYLHADPSVPAPTPDWLQTLQDSAPLGFVFLFPVLLVWVLPLIAAENLSKNEIVRAGYRYTFSNAGIHQKTSVSKVDLQWKAVVDVYESPTAFLLRISKVSAHILPRRCFANEADVATVRKIFRDNVAKTYLRKT